MATVETLTRRLDRWLKAVGFGSGNPFATANAEYERTFLPECFVDTGHYPLILGDPKDPRTTLVLAPRGAGKTAYRVMLEQQGYPQSNTLNVLVISYLNFDHFFEQEPASLRQALQCHLRASLRLGLRSLDATLARFPEIRAGVTPGWRGMLLDLQYKYAPELVPAAAEGSFPNLERTATEDFRTLVALVQQLGIAGLYVMVDRLDEQPETADSPPAILDLLLPLVAHLPLMEHEGVAFKFFLPLEIKALLEETPKVRLDRLRIYTVEWDEALLQQLLEKRLAVFSEGRIKALGQLARTPLNETVDRELVQWANGSPRRLLRLGELLLLEHARRMPDDEALLTPEAWENACLQFQRDYRPPGLSVDPLKAQVRIGTRLIGLTPLEHKFLLTLSEGRGWCEKETLIQKVWDATEGVTDQAVSRLVRRIREKVEPLPGSPIYLLTEHNQGFRLEHLQDSPEL